MMRTIAIGCLLFVQPSFAVEIDATKDFEQISTPPTTLVPNTRRSYQSDRIQIIPEKQNVRVPAGTPGAPAGLRVDSYLLHYDPNLLKREGNAWMRVFWPPAKVTFDQEIVAVFHSDKDLDATDKVFGLSIDYPVGFYYRGTASEGETDDEFQVQRRSVTYFKLFVRDSATEPGTDQMRILLKAN